VISVGRYAGIAIYVAIVGIFGLAVFGAVAWAGTQS
jgi:small basic protein